jgi:hypothetical protein
MCRSVREKPGFACSCWIAASAGYSQYGGRGVATRDGQQQSYSPSLLRRGSKLASSSCESAEMSAMVTTESLCGERVKEEECANCIECFGPVRVAVWLTSALLALAGSFPAPHPRNYIGA